MALRAPLQLGAPRANRLRLLLEALGLGARRLGVAPVDARPLLGAALGVGDGLRGALLRAPRLLARGVRVAPEHGDALLRASVRVLDANRRVFVRAPRARLRLRRRRLGVAAVSLHLHSRRVRFVVGDALVLVHETPRVRLRASHRRVRVARLVASRTHVRARGCDVGFVLASRLAKRDVQRGELVLARLRRVAFDAAHRRGGEGLGQPRVRLSQSLGGIPQRLPHRVDRRDRVRG